MVGAAVEWRPGYWTPDTVKNHILRDRDALCEHIEERKRIMFRGTGYRYTDMDPEHRSAMHAARGAGDELREYAAAQRQLLKTERVRHFAVLLAEEESR